MGLYRRPLLTITWLLTKSKWVWSGNITITNCRPTTALWGRATLLVTLKTFILTDWLWLEMEMLVWAFTLWARLLLGNAIRNKNLMCWLKQWIQPGACESIQIKNDTYIGKQQKLWWCTIPEPLLV